MIDEPSGLDQLVIPRWMIYMNSRSISLNNRRKCFAEYQGSQLKAGTKENWSNISLFPEQQQQQQIPSFELWRTFAKPIHPHPCAIIWLFVVVMQWYGAKPHVLHGNLHALKANCLPLKNCSAPLAEKVNIYPVQFSHLITDDYECNMVCTCICSVGEMIDSWWNQKNLSCSGIVAFYLFGSRISKYKLYQTSKILKHKCIKEKCIGSRKLGPRDSCDHYFKWILRGTQIYKDIKSICWLKMGLVQMENMKMLWGLWKYIYIYMHTTYIYMCMYIHIYTQTSICVCVCVWIYVLSGVLTKFYAHLTIQSNIDIDKNIFLQDSQKE